MTARCFLFFLILLLPGFLRGQELADTARARILLTQSDSLLRKQDLGAALEKAELAKESFAAVLGARSMAAADAWYKIGEIYYYWGKYKSAETAWSTTLSVRSEAMGSAHPDVAAACNALGVAYMMQGKYYDAVSAYEKALNIMTTAYGELNSNVAATYNNIGIVYKHQGKYSKALQYYDKALAIWKTALDESHPNLASVYTNLGVINYEQGKYDKAIQYHEMALGIWLSAYGESHPQIAVSYNNLGIVYEDQGKDSLALQYYEKALDIWSAAFDGPHRLVAQAYNNAGVISLNQKNHGLALQYFEKAQSIILEVLASSHPEVFASYNNMGLVYADQGDYSKAAEYFGKTLDIAIDEFGETHPYIADSYLNLGNVYYKKEEYEKAVQHYEKAVAAFNFSGLGALREVSSVPILLATFRQMGLARQEQYSRTGGLQYLYQAENKFQQAMAALDFQSQIVGEDTKNQLAREAHAISAAAISNQYLLHQVTDSSYHLQKAFDYSERTKSYLLYEAMQEAYALSFAGLPDSLLEREYNLRQDIAFYEKQRQESIFSGLSETDTAVLMISGRLFSLMSEHQALKDQLERDYPRYYGLKYNFATIDVPGVRDRLLGPNQTLLEYFVGDSSIFAFVVNRDSFLVREIKKDFPLDEWVATFRKANDRDHFAGMVREYCQVAHDLYLKLVDPVAEHLKAELIIIPDGVLGYLPFEALLVDSVANPNRWKNHHYLLKDKQVSYCYSATLLQEMREKKHKQEPANSFLAFAPYYDGDTALLAGLFRYADEAARQPLRPLPSSGEEVYGIQRLVGGDVYYHEQATEERFAQLAGGYRVLHLATHGKANDKAGDYSFLAFTEQKDSLENELLYVRDLYNLELNADLVVLSACETGIGELRRGEGIVSLARGFTYAGAKSIVTSLWSVADEKTKDIMAAFYQNLKKGLPKDEALRQAKLEYIDGLEGHTSAHPFYWSGFIGVGDMRPVGF